MGYYKLLIVIGGLVLAATLNGQSLAAQIQVTAVQSFIKDCDGALIKATYNKIDYKYQDWRMAEIVDEGSYNIIKTTAGLSAPIYGILVGANYDGFKQNIKTLKQQQQQSYTSEQFRNISWTGLDPSSVKPYEDCLKAAAQAAHKSLVLLPEGATTTDLSFKLFYNLSGTAAPNPLPVKWTIGEGNVSSLQKSIPAGGTLIVVKRPKREVTLAVNAITIGDGDSAVLTPLPLPLRPEDRFATKCEIDSTPEPRPILAKGGSTSWPCPAMLAGNYRVTVSIVPGSNIPARVGYELDLISIADTTRKTFTLPLTSGNIIDINAEALLPHVFQSIGGIVTLPQGGSTLFSLYIAWIFNHCCFSGDGNAGLVTIPPSVTLRLERLQ